VEEFVEAAFRHVDLDWHDYVVIDKDLFRPAEVDLLVADISKAERELGWTPTVNFDQLVAMMVDSDLKSQAKLTESGVRSTSSKAA